MNCMKKVTLAIWLVVLTIVLPNLVMADEFKLIPSLAVRGAFNDNIFYTADDEEDDFITTISAGLELIERTERLDLDLSATVSPFFYDEYNDLDDVDQNYRGRIGYKITPRVRLSADAGYALDSRRDRDIETTGLVISTVERKRWTGGLSGDFTLSEKSAAPSFTTAV